MQTVKHCCCGCSLKGGTCTLLILTLIGSVLQLLSIASGKQVSATTAVVYIVALLISIAGLYGVNQKNHTFVLPFVILQVVEIVYNIFLLILLIFYQQLFAEIAKGVLEDDPSSDDVKKLEAIKAAFVFLIVIMILFGVLQYYLFVVVYSFYKELKREKTSSPSTYA